MAVTLLRTWGGQQYPWGYQIRIDLTDGSRTFHEQAVFAGGLPSRIEVDAAVVRAIARVTQSLAPPEHDPPRYRVICEDGTEVMV